MNAIVDEGVPHSLVARLNDLDCQVRLFPKQWKGTKNGRLLRLLEEEGFDSLVTCDKSMSSQQQLPGRGVGLVVLPHQKLADLLPHVEAIARAIKASRPGTVLHVETFQ